MVQEILMRLSIPTIMVLMILLVYLVYSNSKLFHHLPLLFDYSKFTYLVALNMDLIYFLFILIFICFFIYDFIYK